jgi:chromosomal replication initiation ATPase DnaA
MKELIEKLDNITRALGNSMREVQELRDQITEFMKVKKVTILPGDQTAYNAVCEKKVRHQVLAEFDANESEYFKNLRSRELKWHLMRSMIALILIEDYGLTLKAIGQIMGGRDHTSIINMRKKAQQFASYNMPYYSKLAIVRSNLQGWEAISHVG